MSWNRGSCLSLFVASLVLLGLAVPGPAWAELNCSAELDQQQVVQGGTVVLTVRASGEIKGSVQFDLPGNLESLVAGSSYSRSQSITGGRSSITISKTFFLSAQQTGTMSIGPVRVSDSDGSCQTEAMTVSIIRASAQVPPSVSGNRVAKDENQQSANGQTAEKSGGKPGDDIFITLEADRQEAWVGQQIILSFRYYHRVNPWNQPQFTQPRTPGFWREELGNQRDYRTTAGGKAYDVTEKRYAIFPTRAGSLRIDPAELAFPDQGLDRFFNSRRRRGPRILRTDPIVLEVKPLPSGQPENFSGLVAGQLRLNAVANLDSVPRGEPVDFQVRLVSDAFLKGFQGLTILEPEGTRMHDAGDDFRTQVERERLFGQVTVEKVVVPEQEGRTKLPAVSLSWFDVNRGQYRTTQAPVHTVFVTPSDNPFAHEEDSGFLRSQVSRLGQDLVFIHNVPDDLSTSDLVFVESPLWWTLLLLPVVVLAGWRILVVRRLSDPVLVRRRQALAASLAILNEPDSPAPTRLARSIGTLVADWTGRPLASVGVPEVQSFCQGLGQQGDASRLAQILENCDTARYGGAMSQEEDDALVKEVKETLDRLHRCALGGAKGAGAPKALTTRVTLLLPWLLTGILFSDAQAATDPMRLVAEGNQAYTEGQVEQSMDLYQQAISLGVHDADVYFNLGNAHARQGQLGRAVASYLRAERLAPRDQDIKDNLAWVRGNIQDLELNKSDLPLFIAEAMAVVLSLTLNQWSVILVLLVWVMVILWAWRLVRRGEAEVLRRALLAGAGCTLMVMAIVLWRWRIEEVRETAVVVVTEVAVRSGPDESFPVQFQVHDGLTIRIQEERRHWVRISLGGESLGWMPVGSVEKIRREF